MNLQEEEQHLQRQLLDQYVRLWKEMHSFEYGEEDMDNIPVGETCVCAKCKEPFVVAYDVQAMMVDGKPFCMDCVEGGS